jgi:hypothetical protein
MAFDLPFKVAKNSFDLLIQSSEIRPSDPHSKNPRKISIIVSKFYLTVIVTKFLIYDSPYKSWNTIIFKAYNCFEMRTNKIYKTRLPLWHLNRAKLLWRQTPPSPREICLRHPRSLRRLTKTISRNERNMKAWLVKKLDSLDLEKKRKL